MNQEFNNKLLHDALLHDVHINWEERRCKATITLVGGKHIAVLWRGVKELHLPHESPWGESASINSVSVSHAGEYGIEMQSGDIITIKARKPKIT